MTPNLAFGANNAIESAASLVNNLHALLKVDPTPDTKDLEKVFAKYQAERHSRARLFTRITATYTRFAAWQNWLSSFASKYIIPLIGDQFIADWVFSLMPKSGIILD